MVASDEGWSGGNDVQRPMSLIELCESPKYWKDIISYKVRTVDQWSDHTEKSLLFYFFIPLSLSMSAALFYSLFLGKVFFFGAFAALGVKLLMLPLNNLWLRYQRHRLRNTHTAMRLTQRNLNDLLKEPLRGKLVIQKLGWAQGGIPEDARKEWINRQDGMGYILVYMLFDDDVDRVVFRLAAP